MWPVRASRRKGPARHEAQRPEPRRNAKRPTYVPWQPRLRIVRRQLRREEQQSRVAAKRRPRHSTAIGRSARAVASCRRPHRAGVVSGTATRVPGTSGRSRARRRGAGRHIIAAAGIRQGVDAVNAARSSAARSATIAAASAACRRTGQRPARSPASAPAVAASPPRAGRRARGAGRRCSDPREPDRPRDGIGAQLAAVEAQESRTSLPCPAGRRRASRRARPGRCRGTAAAATVSA